MKLIQIGYHENNSDARFLEVLRAGGRVAAQVFGKSPGYESAAGVIEQIAGEDEANIFRAPFMLHDPKAVTPLFNQAGFQSINVQTHILPARYASLETFVRTEIDGWVLAGRVDTIAFPECSTP